MRTLAKKLLLLLVSVSVTLLLGEIALRLMGYKFTGSTFKNDPVLGWSLRPGSSAWETEEGVAWTKINSHGYRDRVRALLKPKGGYRVAVLGDSYAEARQVAMDKTFTWIAEEELKRRRCSGSGQIEVLNFGIPGYGTAQELLLLRERVWQFSPDMIVVQFHSGNDIFNNHRALNSSPPDLAPYFVLKHGKLELDDSFRSGRGFNPTYIKLKGLSADMMNRSVLLQMVYKAMRARAQRQEQARLKGDPSTTPSKDSKALPPHYQRYLSFLPPAIPSMDEAWLVTEALIAELGKETKSHNVPLLLMIVPTGPQINPDPKAQDAYRERFGIESLEYADDRVEQVARANGIPVLRLTMALMKEAKRTGTFMAGFDNTAPNDGHLNERGNAVVARELVEAICTVGSEAAGQSQ